MLLKWNENRILFAELFPVDGAQPEGSNIKLLPGVNEISEVNWKCLKGHVQHHLASGALAVLEEKTQTGPGKPQQVASGLKDLSPKKAWALIQETHNPDTLNKWLNDNISDVVRHYVEERIKALGLNAERSTEPKDDDETGPVIGLGDEDIKPTKGAKKE